MTKRKITKGKNPVKPRGQGKKAGKRGTVSKKPRAAKPPRGKKSRGAVGARDETQELKRRLREAEKKAREAKKRGREVERQLKALAKEDKARERKAKAVRARTEKGLKIKRRAVMTSHTPGPDSEGFTPLNYKSPQQKAWETRRLNKYMSGGMSALSALDYAPLNKDQANYLDQIAEDFGDGYLYLPKKERVDYFQRLFQSGSSRLNRYLHFVQEMGFSSRQARTALFSPRAIKV